MAVAPQARYGTEARLLKALAHPTRLFILDALTRGERSVRELADLTSVEMPTMSRHLGVLRSAGFLIDEKRGAQVFYRLCRKEESPQANWWQCSSRPEHFKLSINRNKS